MAQHNPTIDTENRNYLQLAANNIILHLHPSRVSAASLRFTYTWGLGGIAATLTLMLVMTGILLMFRYEPTVGQAYTSIKSLETDVMFGALIRAIHHWSTNLLLIVACLHLARVFLTGGFKQGRTSTWVAGMILLLLVVAFNFTGYLLPWDQLAYWAITVSTSLINYLPIVGPVVSRFILAGPEVGQAALSNFYAIHVAVLPILLSVMMAYHFWKIRKNGGLTQPPTADKQAAGRVATIPNLIQREFAAATVVITGITVWAMLVPAPLEALANPAQSPNPAKAAWYFLGLQELLLHMHVLAAISLVALIMLGFIWMPRLDRQTDNIGVYFRSKKGRWAAIMGAFLGFDIVPLLVVADEYWLDLPAMLPHWPVLISTGLLPLILTLLGLLLIYDLLRFLLKANHSEGLVGLFSFITVGLVALTIIGIFFRGPNMALVLPF
jgi:quinol-cytochrome oxidoreductase complex cytochrome b subunit